MNFFQKNKDRIEEDATRRANGLGSDDVYSGRRRLDNGAIIAIDRIEADPQHREDFDHDALTRLAKSMKEKGQLQPIRVRYDDLRDKYVIIAGERRFRAAALAGLPELECVITEGMPSPAEILHAQIVENAVREDLKPMEEARAFRDMAAAEGLSIRKLAGVLNVSPSKVSRAIALLDLPDELQTKVEAGEIAPRDALTMGKQQASSAAGKTGSRKKKARKERKVRKNGITITVSHRKDVTDEMMREAVHILDQATVALSSSESQPLKKAA